MIPEVKDIIVSLLKKTEAGQVKWVDARNVGMKNVMEEDYVVLLPNSSINVFRGTEGVRLNILNSEGNVVMYVEAMNESLNDVKLLEDLLLSAKRKALGLDETLTEIKEILSKEGVIGDAKPRRFKDNDEF